MVTASEEAQKWMTRLSILMVFLGQTLFWEHIVTYGYFDVELWGHETYGVVLTVIGMVSLIFLKRKVVLRKLRSI
jgi:hypothetical protein